MTNSSKLKAQSSKVEGFTLIEILVASTIFTFVAIVSVGIFVQSTRATEKVNADREVQQAARFAFEQLSRSIRQAGDISIDRSGGFFALRSSPCPTNLVVPKTFVERGGSPQSLCGDRLTLMSGATAETFGYFQAPGMNYSCLARVTGRTLSAATRESCLTPPSVTLTSPNPADPAEGNGFIVTGYYRGATDLEQKPFLKIRATFEATQRATGSTNRKRLTFETSLVARNFEKQY